MRLFSNWRLTILLLALILGSCETSGDDDARQLANQTSEPQPEASTSNARIALKSLIYDDRFMIRHLDDRFSYLRTNDSSGYVGIRDFFELGQAFWPTPEHFNDKNIEQYLYHELRAMDVVKGVFFTDDHWQYSSQRELIESGGWEANKTRCSEQVAFLHEQFKREKLKPGHLFAPGRLNIELSRWIDAWGRPPSESQWGDTFWLGSYRACRLARVPGLTRDLEMETIMNHGIEFNYCVAKLRAKDWPEKDVLRPKLTLRVGICLPRACDTLAANEHRDEIVSLMEYNFSPAQRARYLSEPISDIYCLPLKLAGQNERSEWNLKLDGLERDSRGYKLPFEAQCFCLLSALWLALIALATTCKHLKRSSLSRRSSKLVGERERSGGKLTSWLECLSVQSNWDELMSNQEPSRESRLDLRVLGLIKLLSCLLVMSAHCLEYTYWFFKASTIHIIESRRLHYQTMTWFFKSIDAFMVASGVLIAYTFLRKFPKDKIKLIIRPKVYLALQLARWLRLTPATFYVLAFMKSCFVHLSEGPLWDYATYELSHRGRCRHSSWWRQLLWPILFDWRGLWGDAHQSECMPSSWYIVTDMKMFLVVPFYFYLLYKNKKRRLRIMAATLLVSTLWSYAQLSVQNLVYFRHYFQYGTMHATSITVSHFETSYYSPIGRFYALAIGLYAGIYLFNYKQGKIARWPWFMRGVCVWLACAWQVYDLFVRPIWAEQHFRQTGQVPSESQMKWALLLRQRIDALTIVIITLRLTSDCSSALMRNASFWFKLSKLSYCVYIIHSQLILYTFSATQFSRPDSDPLQLIIFSVFIMTISFAIALPVHLLIESPLALLLNKALDKARGSVGRKSSLAAVAAAELAAGKEVSATGGLMHAEKKHC